MRFLFIFLSVTFATMVWIDPASAQNNILGAEDPATLRALAVQGNKGALEKLQFEAEQGKANAQNNLGVFYINAPTANNAEAIKWFYKSAIQGDALGENWLGWMYEKGRGTPQNYSEAVKWYVKAAAQGSSVAQTSLDEMKKKGLVHNNQETHAYFSKDQQNFLSLLLTVLLLLSVARSGVKQLWGAITQPFFRKPHVEQPRSPYERHATPPPPPAANTMMSIEEAAAVLGVTRHASKQAVKEAHSRLIRKLHPDMGGNDYLASKINQARDILMRRAR